MARGNTGRRVGKARGLKSVTVSRNTNAKAPSNVKGTMRVRNPVVGAVGRTSRVGNPSGSMVAVGRFTGRGHTR